MDFIERTQEYVLRADIPGVHKSEIRVSVDGNVVRFGHQPHPDREQKDEEEQVGAGGMGGAYAGPPPPRPPPPATAPARSRLCRRQCNLLLTCCLRPP